MRKYLLLLVAFLLLVGCSEETVDIEGESLNYEELQEKIEKSNKELEDVESKISTSNEELVDIKSELKSNEDEFSELKYLANNKDEITEEVREFEKKKEELESVIEELEDRLEYLEGEIVRVESEPIKVNPGVYHFGSDIEVGRYKITAQEGQRGNVFFDGNTYFGETFGGGEYAIEEYTFYAENGDQIEASIPIYLYPAE